MNRWARFQMSRLNPAKYEDPYCGGPIRYPPAGVVMSFMSTAMISPEGDFYYLDDTTTHASFARAWYAAHGLPLPAQTREVRIEDWIVIDHGWLALTGWNGVSVPRNPTAASLETLARFIAAVLLSYPQYLEHPVWLATHLPHTSTQVPAIDVVERFGSPELIESFWRALDARETWLTRR